MKIDLNRTVILYGGKKINVQGVIEVSDNTLFLFKGDNGSGKTLSLYLLASILSNRCMGFIKDYDKDQNDQINKKISWVYQEPRDNFISRCSADEIILPLLSSCLGKEEMVGNLEDLLYQADLTDNSILSKKISNLSGGERQKISILVAIASKPDFLFMDEPLSRLDLESQRRCLDLVKQQLEKSTVFIASHEFQCIKEKIDHSRINVINVISEENVIRLESTDITNIEDTPNIDSLNTQKLSINTYLSDDVIYISHSNPKQITFYHGRGDVIYDITKVRIVSGVKGENLISQSRRVRLAKGLNIITGSNGSGKTLFGLFLIGRIPLNPILKLKSSLYVQSNENRHNTSRFNASSLRRAGRSTFVYSEPDLYITGATVEDEISLFNMNEDPYTKNLLQTLQINLTEDIDKLSYGQKRAVVIASLPKQLDLIVIDEPFTGLSDNSIVILGKLIENRIEKEEWKSCVFLLNSFQGLQTAFPQRS